MPRPSGRSDRPYRLSVPNRSDDVHYYGLDGSNRHQLKTLFHQERIVIERFGYTDDKMGDQRDDGSGENRRNAGLKKTEK